MERCDGCGFAWEAPGRADIVRRLGAIGDAYAGALRSSTVDLHARPAPGTWSPMEYGAHVRDVMLSLRDRIILGLAEDDPIPKPMHADVRIDAGLYAADTPTELVTEIAVAASLLAKTLDALAEDDVRRPLFYPWPRPATRDLRWVAAQALHEAEHHLADIERAVAAG
jgi:hypothetical protein